MDEEMEKYGSIPAENEKLDDVLDLFEDVSMEEIRETLRKDSAYGELFSTTKQQQYLHIMFDKLGRDLKDFLEERFGFRSTKLLYKEEATLLIDEHKKEYDMAVNEEYNGGGLF